MKNGKPELTKRQRKQRAKTYRAMLDALGLNQLAAAKFLGVNERTSRRYASGDWPLPRATALLLRIMAARRISPEKAENLLLGL
jgi:hypothetical protein